MILDLVGKVLEPFYLLNLFMKLFITIMTIFWAVDR